MWSAGRKAYFGSLELCEFELCYFILPIILLMDIENEKVKVLVLVIYQVHTFNKTEKNTT